MKQILIFSLITICLSSMLIANNKQAAAKHVGQAEQQMQEAVEALALKDNKIAKAHQKKAIRELEQARTLLEEILVGINEDESRELSINLGQHFKSMLNSQIFINRDTISLDETDGVEQWLNPEIIAWRKITGKQKALIQASQQALDIFKKEVKSIAFLRIVEKLRDDILDVHHALKSKQVGENTQANQEEIVEMLRDLIDVWAKFQKDNPSTNLIENCRTCQLVPNSIELKLLKLTQLRVNKKTEHLSKAHKVSQVSAEQYIRNTQKLAELQQTLVKIAIEMNNPE